MNFLKKKLKPLTSGLTNTNQTTAGQGKRGGHTTSKDLEEDLYDEYVVEAPPHPSELLALGVEPTEIDVNNPDKLRELYEKAIEEGKDKKTNSVLLARQRQKEELEEKKRTREEWKFFESLTTRVEQVVKSSQKNLDHWKETSAIDQLAKPDYELRQTANEVFKPVTNSKIEKDANNWIDFDEDQKNTSNNKEGERLVARSKDEKQVDEFGCPDERKATTLTGEGSTLVVDELLEDFGIDLRTEEQKRAIERKLEENRKEAEKAPAAAAAAQRAKLEVTERKEQPESVASRGGRAIDIRPAARPRPRPRPTPGSQEETSSRGKQAQELEVDPFDTSFVEPVVAGVKQNIERDHHPLAAAASAIQNERLADLGANETRSGPFVDPFDTSHVNL